jgi:hypothetical protein
MLDLTEKEALSNRYSFSNPVNFSFRNNSIRMFDYEGRGVKDVVQKYGQILSENFDPAKKPSWEK